MRIMVINPNTTASMTDKIGEAAGRSRRPAPRSSRSTPPRGRSRSRATTTRRSAPSALLEEVRRGEAEGVDGYVIACFGDPGLLAAREIATGPVLGIAEAAMHAASFIATGFSVVTTLGRTKIIAEHLAHAYGMSRLLPRRSGPANSTCCRSRTKARTRARIITEECLRAATRTAPARSCSAAAAWPTSPRRSSATSACR